LTHYFISVVTLGYVRGPHLVCTSEVNSHDLIPHLLVHVDESLVPEDTGIGNKDVDGAESIDSSLDDSITILSRTDSSDSMSSD
jgi:hypothetical protein